MKISVVIPTYNNNEMLKNLLDKLNVQSVLPSELIIIEDGPADTFNLIASNKYLFPISRIKHEINVGVNACWNEGVEHARGELICILNDDIMVSKEFIRKTIEGFTLNERIGIVFYNNSTIEGVDNEPKDIRCHFTKIRRGWAFTIRKDVFNKIGPIPVKGMKNFCGDNFLFTRCRVNGFKTAFLPNCNVWHKGSHTLYKIFKKREVIQNIIFNEKQIYNNLD